MLDGSDPAAAPSVRKVFFDTFDEAASWLNDHRGAIGSGWKPCRTCRPSRPADGGVADDDLGAGQQAGSPAGTLGRADGVFREAEVEHLLYAHLRSAGYMVQEKVRVSNGIVDAVATKGGKRLVIEVKGEDAGGYVSAQMNLQMAFGQISSRMTDPDATYAVAFPATADYMKALRTFRGSPVFERLNLVCYLVQPGGDVITIEARDARGWIEALEPGVVPRPLAAVRRAKPGGKVQSWLHRRR
jgi:hypothetical protein